jgi:hypothetical protein
MKIIVKQWKKIKVYVLIFFKSRLKYLGVNMRCIIQIHKMPKVLMFYSLLNHNLAIKPWLINIYG